MISSTYLVISIVQHDSVNISQHFQYFYHILFSLLITSIFQENDDQTVETNCRTSPELIKSSNPDISIIPIKRKKPLFKIRLFDKTTEIKTNQSYSEDEIYQIEGSPSKRGPKNSVRIITKEEAENSSESYSKRKSLPLEKCPICKKYFRRMATHLMKHQEVDSNLQINGLECNFCQKTFNTQSNLHIHLRTHTGSKPYVCRICGKAFSQSCNLVNHERIHSGEKPFKCPHCDKAFTQSGNLNNHIRLHTNEKPFKCHFCDKAFVQSGNLNSHIMNNHRSRDLEPSLAESILNHTI